MTKEDCDYCIDKAIAAGMLDSDGGLNFVIKGSREEIIQGILERAAIWGIPMGRAEAERLTDKAIRQIRARRALLWLPWTMLAVLLWTIISR